MANYYKHSGKAAPQGLLFGLLLGAALPTVFFYDGGHLYHPLKSAARHLHASRFSGSVRLRPWP